MHIVNRTLDGFKMCPIVCLSTNTKVGTQVIKDARLVKIVCYVSLERAYKMLENSLFFSPDSLVRNSMRDACPKRARFERDIFAD